MTHYDEINANILNTLLPDLFLHSFFFGKYYCYENLYFAKTLYLLF
jgi:hypothetical protein